MLAAIDGAQSRINFETYVFKDGEIGDRFVEALARAAERGVTVRIVLDPIGSVARCRRASRSAREGGRQAGLVQPARLLQRSKTPTTAPIARRSSSTATSRSSAAWASPITGSATRRTRSTGATPSSRSPAPPCARSKPRSTRTGSSPAACRRRRSIRNCRRAPTGARSIVLWSNPTSGASNIKLMYLLAIGAARKTIDIQSPYITLDPSTHWSLDRGAPARRADSHARRRRPSPTPCRSSMPAATTYQDLLDHGIEIFEYQPTMMHAKAMMVDGVFSIIGSANFGNRSFELNDELAIGVDDAELAAQLTARLRDRHQVVEAARRGDVAEAALLRRQDQRVVLELLRRDVLI